MTLALSEPRAPRVLPSPVRSELAARLAERGIDCRPGDGESAEEHGARLETALMALFRDQRSDEAFEALYEHAHASVWRGVCSSLRGSAHGVDPSELVQDVFVNVYRYAGSFRDEHSRSFRAWASAICGNVVRRHMVERGRPSLQELGGAFEEPADPRDGPAHAALVGEERAELARAWQLLLHFYAAAWRTLSPRDRLALELVEVDGLSYVEACARLGVGMSNMKMIMFRARRRVRARMDRAFESAPPARRLAG